MTSLAEVLQVGQQQRLAQLGHDAWVELHAWADRFKAAVGDSCECGDLAVSAARALHDTVNVKLGRAVLYPDDLHSITHFMHESLAEIEAGHVHHQQQDEGSLIVVDDSPSLARLFNLLDMSRTVVIPREQMGFLDFPLPSAVTPGPAVVVTPTRPFSPAPTLIPTPPAKKYALFPFQAEGVAWLADKETALLADDMGLGKTPQAITWASSRQPALVIVPAALLYNWQAEIQEKWRLGDTVTILSGDEVLPRRLAQWTITTYGQVAKYLPSLRRAGFRSLIIDEAHLVKNLDTQRTRNVLELVAPAKATPGQRLIPSRLAVTGTPIMNRPPELFSLLVFLGKAERSGWNSFIGEYTIRESRGGREYFIGYTNLDKLHAQLKPFMLRRLKTEVLKQLPPKIYRPIYTNLSNAAEYREAERNFLTWLEKNVGKEAVARIAFSVRAQILVQLNHLRQLAARGKVRAVADFLKPCEATGHKVLVFSNFVFVVEDLHRAKGGILYTGATSKEQRDQLVRRFQSEPGTCYFFGTVGAAGVGITLTAADRAVFVDLPWTPAAKQQAEDRAHRIGQKSQVEVIPFLARGTIDERIMQLISDKEKVIAQAIDGFTADRAAQESVTTQLMESFIRQAQTGQAPIAPAESYIGDDFIDEADTETLQGMRQWTLEEEASCPGMILINRGVLRPYCQDYGHSLDVLLTPDSRIYIRRSALSYVLIKDGKAVPQTYLEEPKWPAGTVRVGPACVCGERLPPAQPRMLQRPTAIKSYRFTTHDKYQEPQQPDTQPGYYYVTVRDGERHAFLLGPFKDDHAKALSLVRAARDKAEELDPRAVFYGFGTARFALTENPVQGVLNKYFQKEMEAGPGAYTPAPPPKQIRLLQSRSEIRTLSGRVLYPPRQKDAYSKRGVSGDLLIVDAWLLEQGKAEAIARGDDFVLHQFQQVNPKRMTTAERDGLNLYLFGQEEIPLPSPRLFQRPDPWGSRCRDPLGQWTVTSTCGPVPTDGLVAIPKAPSTTVATSADGVRQYQFVHRVLDASRLVPSHDPFTFAVNPAYSQKIQPRLRDRAAAELQVKRIASQLSPEALLTDFHTLDRGAPIVGPDMLVESGNGRVMGIIRAATEHPEVYGRYKRQLEDRAPGLGIDPANIAKAGTPVLVRVRTTRLSDQERIDFVREANVPSGISRSAIEQARTDAEKVTLNMLESLDVGETESVFDALRATRNAEFVRRFLSNIPENERGQLVDAQGLINMDGIRRTAQAVFVAAFGAGEPGLRLGEMAFESIDQEIRNVFNGLSRSIVNLAHAESLVRSGNRDTDLSIAGDLAQTIRIFTKVKNDPTLTVDTYLTQTQLFERELTPFQEGMLRVLNENIRSSKRLANIFRSYGQLVIDQPPPTQAGLFGPTERPAKAQLWAQAVAAREFGLERREAVLVQDRTPYYREDRIDWCNIKEAERGTVMGWRPLRGLLLYALGMGLRGQVCTAGFAGEQYQVTVMGLMQKPRLADIIKNRLRKLAQSMGSSAKEVMVFGGGDMVWQVTLPGKEAGELKLKPMTPTGSDRPFRERVPQPALFQATMSAKPICTPAQLERWERCVKEVKARNGKVNPWAVCTASVGCRRGARLSNSFLEFLMHGAASATGATLAATLLSRALGGGLVVTSPEAGLLVVDDTERKKKEEEEKRKAGKVSPVSPVYVEGDQAQVDIGTLLNEIDAILKDDNRLGIVDADRLTVVREGI